MPHDDIMTVRELADYLKIAKKQRIALHQRGKFRVLKLVTHGAFRRKISMHGSSVNLKIIQNHGMIKYGIKS